jgi:GT2 family glycosyltransferase
MRDHHRSPPDPDAPDLYPVDVLGGCGTLIPVSVFRRIGLYDERALRHYGADYELSRRAARAGFRLMVDKRSALHVRTRESGLHVTASDSDIRALLRSFWHLKSANDLRLRWRFARRVCPPRWLPLYVPSDYARVVLGSSRRWAMRGDG